MKKLILLLLAITNTATNIQAFSSFEEKAEDLERAYIKCGETIFRGLLGIDPNYVKENCSPIFTLSGTVLGKQNGKYIVRKECDINDRCPSFIVSVKDEYSFLKGDKVRLEGKLISNSEIQADNIRLVEGVL